MRTIENKFNALTKYIENIQELESFGEWIFDKKSSGTSEDPMQAPFLSYDELIYNFIEDFYKFSDSHPEYELTNYQSILRENNIEWNLKSMSEMDTLLLDSKCILALIMGVIRGERFSEGSLLWCLKEGPMLSWLKRLSALD